MEKEFSFVFGNTPSKVRIQDSLPDARELSEGRRALLVCDENTSPLALKTAGDSGLSLCVLPQGEDNKTWAAVESILKAAREAGLGRDGVFIGIGGGVTSDLCAFAASVYMRGAALCIVSTTLLGMVDAAIGGKTGFDFLGIKNLVGTFYPAGKVIMPLEALKTLREKEWKSGLAELVKTAVLGDSELFGMVKNIQKNRETLAACIARAVEIKGRIVEEDPRETGKRRALLNLGHTFGHALESAAGLGKISHGEAVAWGMARSCELGLYLGVTPPGRARDITELLKSFGYETRAPYPTGADAAVLMEAMAGDKKRKSGKLNFIVPAPQGAEIVPDPGGGITGKIINGELSL
ncbi:MAG: 3-dehydroquinate synthase [Treponema sp.]|nr:3-dehydroquinate synthase [Treponema sp.]